MKKYVWSETRVEGGRTFTGSLHKPPSATGAYQNQAGGGRGFGGGGAQTQAPPPEYYKDAAVVAYRAPEIDRPMNELDPKVTASGGTFDVAALTDGDLSKSTLLPAAPVGERSWIQYEFPQAQTFRGNTACSGCVLASMRPSRDASTARGQPSRHSTPSLSAARTSSTPRVASNSPTTSNSTARTCAHKSCSPGNKSPTTAGAPPPSSPHSRRARQQRTDKPSSSEKAEACGATGAPVLPVTNHRATADDA